MKIKKQNAGHLTNFEVLDFLRSRGASKDPSRVMSSLTPSEFKVFDYLVETAACDQTKESINEFMDKSKEYQLAKAEVMSILNIRPTSTVEIDTIIESWDKRFEDKIDELTEMIGEVLPPPPSQLLSDDGAAPQDTAEVAEDEDAEAGEGEDGDAENMEE